MAKERNRAATVIQQTGNRVEVEHNGQRLTAGMAGFPPGFTLTAGARVILVDDESGVVARPLVRAIRTGAAPGGPEQAAPLSVEGRRVEMQDATIVDRRPRTNRPGDEDVVWVVERAGPAATDQAIAVRRR